MRKMKYIKILTLLGLALAWVVQGGANEPVFLQWLAPDNPGDAVIRVYWEQYSTGALSPEEIVDLGTMLFSRGYPRDAERLFHEALEQNDQLFEAWFRIGLVNHQAGNISTARKAYKKCLKLFKGHGWCNFYLGLLEEQDRNGPEAMKYYEKAFRYAPALGDKKINPELKNSKLAVGAWLKHARQDEFHNALPMAFLAPDKMTTVRKEELSKIQKNKKQETPQTVQLQEISKKEVSRTRSEETSKVIKPQKKLAPAKTVSPAKTSPQGGSPTARGSHRRPPTSKRRPTPTPLPKELQDSPFGLPGSHSVSSDGYPGF